MSKFKLLLIYLVIFLVFASLAYFLVRFLSKTKSGPELKQNPATSTKKSTPLPPNYKPPPVLTRLDFPKVTPGSTIGSRISKPFSPKNSFNTIDDSGNYFLFGVYETNSGKTLVAGIVRKLTIDQNLLKLQLEDEFGDLISTTIEMSISNDKSVSVGTRNTDRALDLSKPVNIANRQLNSFKDSLTGSRIVVEINPKGKILYLAYMRE